MNEPSDWSIPSVLQPKPTQVSFDLQAALHSVVQLRSEIAEDAFTANILGTERSGNGIVIRYEQQTVVLTIGYLITEAHSVWLTTHEGKTVAGHPFAYDQVTGFGLVLPLGELDTPSMALGKAASLAVGSEVIIIGYGNARHSLNSKLIARREFAGYWEYLLDEALFATPPHPQWGGTALIDHEGRLAGVGSLLIQERLGGKPVDVNMFVPIDLLTPILHDLMRYGKVQRLPRPWLGVYASEQAAQRVVVAGVIERGPAQLAGLRPGDTILAVGDKPVTHLAGFYRALWALGPAGSSIVLSLQRGKRDTQVAVQSASRDDFLLRPTGH